MIRTDKINKKNSDLIEENKIEMKHDEKRRKQQKRGRIIRKGERKKGEE